MNPAVCALMSATLARRAHRYGPDPMGPISGNCPQMGLNKKKGPGRSSRAERDVERSPSREESESEPAPPREAEVPTGGETDHLARRVAGGRFGDRRRRHHGR